MTRTMIPSTTSNRGTMAFSMLLLIASASGCATQPSITPSPRPVVKYTGENESEVVGAHPVRLGGPGDTARAGLRLNGTKTVQLPDYIENLSDAALVLYLDKLQYDTDPLNTETEDVECVHTNSGNAPCLPGESAHVSIQPEGGAHKWSYANIPAHGIVVARILNYDQTDRQEKNFAFPPNTKVWWVVDRDPSTHAVRSRFFRRNYSPTAPAVDRVGSVHEFIFCDHVHKVHHGQAIAKYVSCSQSLTMRPDTGLEDAAASAEPPATGIFHEAAYRHAVPLPKRPTVMALTATWITCDMGCCSTTR